MAAHPSASTMQAFRTRAAAASAAAHPGTVTINGTDYDGMVIARPGNIFLEEEGWIQVHKLTAEFPIATLPLSVVIDTDDATRPMRVDLILIHDSIRYRLSQVSPHPSGITVLIRAIEEHGLSKG